MKNMNAQLNQYFISASAIYSVIFQWGPMLFWSPLPFYGQNIYNVYNVPDNSSIKIAKDFGAFQQYYDYYLTRTQR